MESDPSMDDFDRALLSLMADADDNELLTTFDIPDNDEFWTDFEQHPEAALTSSLEMPPSTSLSSESNTYSTTNETNSLSGSLDMAGGFESKNKETTSTIADSDVTETATMYTRSDDTLYFAIPADPNTTRWRFLVKEYSENRIDFPTWVERIGTEIIRRLQEDYGIHQFMVRVHGKPTSTAEWRMATYQEIIGKTRQRFKDDRKPKPSQLNRPVGRPRKLESRVRKPAPMREPCYNITERTVCIGWHVHPGTIKWRDVLRTFSRNTDAYPEWNDDISYLVKNRLAMEFYTPFIVARDRQGNPCEPGSNGLWVVATDEEILEVNKLEFYAQRRECDNMSTIDVEHKWLSSPNQDGGDSGTKSVFSSKKVH